ncbi:hypothetical protein [Pandoraea pulmonicola]|uniref:HTH psq-type domain-containing protein n=1 Tax=Pandoraea pulmonicola TaxID=93221 RepID=A0ABM5RWL5_PANPU|nr:hypothetical protein [Pandoraea pulmonicola]AJC19858.1 hypothetical protein RO07_04020 [Pandoraea pulmonicola]
MKEIHAQVEAHGEAWFKNEGGCKGLATKYDIPYKTLKTNYFFKNGALRPLGDDIVNGASKKPVTDDILRECEQLRSEGKWPKGGVAEVAKMLNVKYGSLGTFYKADGTPRPPRKTAPQDARSARRPRITAFVKEIHAQMEALGEDGGKAWFQAEGGCKGLAKKYGIKPKTLRYYFLENGDLTSNGNDIVNAASKRPLTVKAMLECERLHSEGKWPKGGLKMVAKMLNVRFDSLKNYFLADGTPTTPLGEARLKSIREGISVAQREVQ